jgi:exonuclease VII small subunit
VIAKLIECIRAARRRERLVREIKAALDSVDARPVATKKFRRLAIRNLRPEFGRLQVAAQSRRTRAELENVAESLRRLEGRCDAVFAEDARAVELVRHAKQRLNELERQASGLPGKPFFERVRGARRGVEVELRAASDAKDERSEKKALEFASQKLRAAEAIVAGAAKVHASLPVVEVQVKAIPRDEVELNVGSVQTLKEIEATLQRAQSEAARGDYPRADAHLGEVERLRASLTDRLGYRCREAREAVDRWLKLPAVVAAFPEIGQFPEKFTGQDVLNWVELRARIHTHVEAAAADARRSNWPSTYISGAQVDASSPLRMELRDATNHRDLLAFVGALEEFTQHPPESSVLIP